MSALRKILVLLCVVAFGSGPVLGIPGGVEGLVNLPGGCSLASRAGGGPSGFTPVVRSSAQDLTLVLDPAMVGAIVSITAGGAESAVVSETVGGRYVMTAKDMRELISAGVSDVVLEFVSPNGLWLRVKVTFGEQQKLVVTVY